jgi:hypothetical protein
MFELLSCKASERKLRLYAVAVLTADMASDTDREYRVRMETALRFADGNVSLEVLREHWGMRENTWPERARQWALEVAAGEASEEPTRSSAIVKLLHELFAHPFRPAAFDPAWRTSDVLLLANGIYAERAFDRMPILADALQDAGCDSAAALDHLRDAAAPHVRGCWALDLVLGKE